MSFSRRTALKAIGVLTAALGLRLTLAQGAAGSVVKVAKGSYRDLGVAEFKARLEAPGNFLLINTHVPYEGEIAGTELFLPFDAVGQYKALLPRDKGFEILVYCRSGRMSAIASETMVRLGYTNVKNLQGGMIGWQKAGYPLKTLSGS